VVVRDCHTAWSIELVAETLNFAFLTLFYFFVMSCLIFSEFFSTLFYGDLGLQGLGGKMPSDERKKI
jgi:hypothetical protein